MWSYFSNYLSYYERTLLIYVFMVFIYYFIFRSQEDNKSRFSKTKSLRDKFRDSKTWSLRRSVEKESSPVTPNHHCDKNGNSDNNSTTSTSSTYAGQLSRLFSLRRSLGPGSFEPPKASMPCVAEEEEQMAG